MEAAMTVALAAAALANGMNQVMTMAKAAMVVEMTPVLFEAMAAAMEALIVV